MIRSLSNALANTHIESLEAVFSESKTAIEWLVIAHNDSRMMRSLSDALSRESAAVLEVSQDTWDFGGDELPEAIEWALRQGKVKNVVLVGHSQAGGSASRASLVASTTKAEIRSGNERLIAGVQLANAHNRDAQARFALLVRQMSQIPVVHSRCANGELATYGLFYRAESGLFLAYNGEQDECRPLM